jgi:hypothetical protein
VRGNLPCVQQALQTARDLPVPLLIKDPVANVAIASATICKSPRIFDPNFIYYHFEPELYR